MSKFFDKFNLIKGYLLDDSINTKMRKERFSIAWDVSEELGKIRIFMKREVISKLIEKVKENFSGFEFIDSGFSSGTKWAPFTICKSDWKINGQIILAFDIEAGQYNFCHFYFGIAMHKSDWEINRESSEVLKQISERILSVLEKKDHGWKTDDEKWIAWKSFREPYSGAWQKEYFLEIIEKGPEYVADKYLEEFIVLKEVENLVDDFVKEYKALTSNSL